MRKRLWLRVCRVRRTNREMVVLKTETRWTIGLKVAYSSDPCEVPRGQVWSVELNDGGLTSALKRRCLIEILGTYKRLRVLVLRSVNLEGSGLFRVCYSDFPKLTVGSEITLEDLAPVVKQASITIFPRHRGS